VLYSEIDDQGWEVRSIDQYANGRLDVASDRIETGKTALSTEPIPPLSEINADPQFEGVEISCEEFEAVWNRAKEWLERP
jgi:hypothetical protein